MSVGVPSRLVSSKEEIDEADFFAWAPPVLLGLEVVTAGAGASALAGAFFVALAIGSVSIRRGSEEEAVCRCSQKKVEAADRQQH